MAKTRKLKFTCPASVEDRTVKSGVVKLSIDPSESAFLLKSKARERPVALLLVPDKEHSEIKPISMFGVVKDCTLTFQDVVVPDDRLAELEFLVREKHAIVELRVETEHADLFEELPDGGADH